MDPPRLPEAENWLLKAASTGNTDAMINLGNLLRTMDPPRLPEAENWLLIAARALSNRSYQLNDAGGRTNEALDAAQEAIALYRELAATRPAEFTPDLARALSNFSYQLNDAGGRTNEALDVAHEAVALYRELAATRPAEFTPDLARALSNLSTRLNAVGRRDEALHARHAAN